MSSSQYRIFVCTKQRSASDPDGSGCGNCGGEAIYTAFATAIAQAKVGDRIQLKAAGCLDHCTAGRSRPFDLWDSSGGNWGGISRIARVLCALRP